MLAVVGQLISLCNKILIADISGRIGEKLSPNAEYLNNWVCNLRHRQEEMLF